jgi:endonuclease/exonuclease/phosphatase family metal-dependent hydrolase
MKELIILVSLFFISCSKDPVITDPDDTYFKNSHFGYTDSLVKVVTYNVQLGFTSDQDPFNDKTLGASPEQIHQIANIIRKADPNIVLLQEVPKNRCNTVVKNFIESLADSLNMNFSFGGHGNATDKCKGTWGNATLTKFKINAIENIVVRAVDKYKTRSVLRTELQNGKRSLNTFNLHHDGRDENEIGNTLNFVSESTLPLIIGGDFNRTYDNPELKLPGFEDYFDYYFKGIDRIYGNLDAQLIFRGYINNSNKVSDHYAMFIHLKLK